jgi:hypothetical protein
LKRILLMLLTGCLLIIFGCSNAPVRTGNNVNENESQVTGKNVSENESQVSGKYVHERTTDILIELKDDGTYCHKFGKRSKCGKYEIDGNRVILKLEKGNTYELKIEGKSLIDNEGLRYTK